MLVRTDGLHREIERRESGMSKPTAYHGWYGYESRESIHVHSETQSVKVTYRGEDGSKFRVIVHQKPNPIGFTARLPGDGKTNGLNR